VLYGRYEHRTDGSSHQVAWVRKALPVRGPAMAEARNPEGQPRISLRRRIRRAVTWAWNELLAPDGSCANESESKEPVPPSPTPVVQKRPSMACSGFVG